jgi:hypothetical protein
MIIHDCEQGTDEWFRLKAGIPSSSNAGMLVTGEGKPSTQLDAYAARLAAEKMKGGPIDDGFGGNQYTDRGVELEELSRADYAMTRQVQIQEVGFITDDLMRYGASTDGLVGDDGVVEFKNLITKTMGELILYLDRNGGKTPPKYIPQLQMELLVTGRAWVDIVFYHPDFTPIIHRHTPDPVFQKVLESQIKKVITERNRIHKIFKTYQS